VAVRDLLAIQTINTARKVARAARLKPPSCREWQEEKSSADWLQRRKNVDADAAFHFAGNVIQRIQFYQRAVKISME
jgi:hypothetical protein